LTGCIYCIDNDILKKLATFDLFDETLKLFDISCAKTKVLETAKHKFWGDWERYKNGKYRKYEDQFVNYERIIQIAINLPQIIELEINQDFFIMLSSLGHKDIESSDAILISHISEIIQSEKSAQLLTGDKRLLRALQNIDISMFREALVHKIWCLEQLVLKNIETHGFEFVRDKIVPVRECDQAIKAVFGSGEVSTRENSLSTLKSYIEELREETGNLLHPYPNEF